MYKIEFVVRCSLVLIKILIYLVEFEDVCCRNEFTTLKFSHFIQNKLLYILQK